MSAEDTTGSPAERRLDEHLELLRSHQPAGDRSLAPRVVRTARWQRALRAPIQVAAAIAGAIIDGVRTLTRGRRGPGR